MKLGTVTVGSISTVKKNLVPSSSSSKTEVRCTNILSLLIWQNCLFVCIISGNYILVCVMCYILVEE